MCLFVFQVEQVLLEEQGGWSAAVIWVTSLGRRCGEKMQRQKGSDAWRETFGTGPSFCLDPETDWGGGGGGGNLSSVNGRGFGGKTFVWCLFIYRIFIAQQWRFREVKVQIADFGPTKDLDLSLLWKSLENQSQWLSWVVPSLLKWLCIQSLFSFPIGSELISLLNENLLLWLLFFYFQSCRLSTPFQLHPSSHYWSVSIPLSRQPPIHPST